jgi:sucrose-6-phosphate hydrolase SacC (GH32 family)
MTLPRILSIGADGYLREQVAPEFAMLRGEAKRVTAAPLTDEALVLEGISGDVLEIEAEFAAGNRSAFGLELRRSGSGRPAFLIAVQRGILSVGNYRIYIGYHDRYKLSVFLDKRCVEVFLNDGFAAVYSAVEADRADQGIAVFSRASAPSLGASGRGPAAPVRLESLTVWPLKPAVFSLGRFHV